MSEYVKTALFVHEGEGYGFIQSVLNNSFGVKVSVVECEKFKNDPLKYLNGCEHVIVSGELPVVKTIFDYAIRYKYSVGIVPLRSQRSLIRCYHLPKRIDEAIKLSFRSDGRPIDLIYCNDAIMLFKTTVGRVPLLDCSNDASVVELVFSVFGKLRGLRLLGFDFSTFSGKNIHSAASGCMIVQHHEGTLASKLISHDSSLNDGMISLVIAAPFSIVDYLKMLSYVLIRSFRGKRISNAVGLIKSREVTIDSEVELQVDIDGVRATRTPLKCVTVPNAVKVNVGEDLTQNSEIVNSEKEKIDVSNLPRGKELARAKDGRVPFFSYVSEERFKDLFTALHNDSKTDSIYLVLILLSTMLATVGLYLNSSSVIIGAMLLAPLMTPIVSFSMGLLRQNTSLLKKSLFKILIGVVLALVAAALMTIILPYDPITPEMQARLNPSLLDLAVAIIAGVAGAYTKSFKEILQSLAGVAIAVALVPPLAVAGIGLGRMDLDFFGAAFLLFSTNLIGIVIAATITFRFLGYSGVVHDKKGFSFVLAIMIAISIPLYLSYEKIVKKHDFEFAWKHERFIINGKYLIVKKAQLSYSYDKQVLIVDILARERLTRSDMFLLKRKIQRNFSKKLVIRAHIVYIL